MNELLFTAITRFGTVALLLFVVGILLGFFRYLMRLSAYYDARILAIKLTYICDAGAVERFKTLATALNAETIDFEKQPPTPLELIAQLGKAKE